MGKPAEAASKPLHTPEMMSDLATKGHAGAPHAIRNAVGLPFANLPNCFALLMQSVFCRAKLTWPHTDPPILRLASHRSWGDDPRCDGVPGRGRKRHLPSLTMRKKLVITVNVIQQGWPCMMKRRWPNKRTMNPTRSTCRDHQRKTSETWHMEVAACAVFQAAPDASAHHSAHAAAAPASSPNAPAEQGQQADKTSTGVRSLPHSKTREHQFSKTDQLCRTRPTELDKHAQHVVP